MGMLNDYYCNSHGIFEAWEAKCPMKHCEGEISKVFLKPVALKSTKTKATDKNLKQLAIEYDMTDIKSTKEGEHQTGYMKRKNKLSDKDFAEATAAMEANNASQEQDNAKPVYRNGGDQAIWGGGAGISMKSVMGGQFRSVAGESVGVNPKDAGHMTGPRPGVVMRDHENLQVSK